METDEIVIPEQFVEKTVNIRNKFEEVEKQKLHKLTQGEEELQLQKHKRREFNESSGLSFTDEIETGSDKNDEDNMTTETLGDNEKAKEKDVDAIGEKEEESRAARFMRIGWCPVCRKTGNTHSSADCPEGRGAVRMYCDLCRGSTCTKDAEHRNCRREIVMLCGYCYAVGDHWSIFCPRIPYLCCSDSSSEEEKGELWDDDNPDDLF